jgi:hypothetical protein
LEQSQAEADAAAEHQRRAKPKRTKKQQHPKDGPGRTDREAAA